MHLLMAYFVYILQSERDGTYYVGQTTNVDERVRRHNQGRSSYTRGRGPWVLVYQEEVSSRSEAARREREIKKRKERDYIEQLVRASRS